MNTLVLWRSQKGTHLGEYIIKLQKSISTVRERLDTALKLKNKWIENIAQVPELTTPEAQDVSDIILQKSLYEVTLQLSQIWIWASENPEDIQVAVMERFTDIISALPDELSVQTELNADKMKSPKIQNILKQVVRRLISVSRRN